MRLLYSLWCVGHGKANKVAAGQREENHDDCENAVVGKQHGKVVARLDVTEHQQRDEHHPGDDQYREETRLFPGLQGEREGGRVRKGEYMKWRCGFRALKGIDLKLRANTLHLANDGAYTIRKDAVVLHLVKREMRVFDTGPRWRFFMRKLKIASCVGETSGKSSSSEKKKKCYLIVIQEKNTKEQIQLSLPAWVNVRYHY